MFPLNILNDLNAGSKNLLSERYYKETDFKCKTAALVRTLWLLCACFVITGYSSSCTNANLKPQPCIIEHLLQLR